MTSEFTMALLLSKIYINMLKYLPNRDSVLLYIMIYDVPNKHWNLSCTFTSISEAH